MDNMLIDCTNKKERNKLVGCEWLISIFFYYAGLRCISVTSANRNFALLIVSTIISAVKCREVKRYAVFNSCEGTNLIIIN